MPKCPGRIPVACTVALLLAVAASVRADEVAAGTNGQTTREVILTRSVAYAWISSCYDRRVAEIYGGVQIDDAPEAGLEAPVAAIGALRTNATLDALVRAHGFIDAGAWVSATLKVNAGIMQCLLTDMRSAMEEALPDKNSVEYNTAAEEIARETAGLREAWGTLSSDEQEVVSELLEDIRLAIVGERPRAKDPLTLEQVQRWVACAKDQRVTPSLKTICKQFAQDPAALRRQIALAAVLPEIDAAAREQGFAGAYQWGRTTAKIIGAMREHGAELRLTDLDERAADYTPDEYRRRLDAACEDLAVVQLAFGCASEDDVAMVEKYYKAIRGALGLSDDEPEQKT